MTSEISSSTLFIFRTTFSRHVTTTAMRTGSWLLFPCLFFIYSNPVAGQVEDFGPSKFFYYTPGTVHVPYLANKKDGDVGIGYNLGSKSTAFEARAVYSPIRYGAVMFNYYRSGSKSIRTGDKAGTNYQFADISFGVYQEKKGGSASIFAGVGQGKLYNNYGADKFSRFTTRRWFLQPSIAYQGQNYRAGLALRLSRLYYPKGVSSYDIIGRELATIQKIEKDAPFFLPEVGFMGSINMRAIIVSVNITTIFPDTDNLNFSRFNVGLMIHYALGTIAGNREKKRSEEPVN